MIVLEFYSFPPSPQKPKSSSIFLILCNDMLSMALAVIIWVDVGWAAILIFCFILPVTSACYRRRRNARHLRESFSRVQSHLADMDQLDWEVRRVHSILIRTLVLSVVNLRFARTHGCQALWRSAHLVFVLIAITSIYEPIPRMFYFYPCSAS